MTTKDDRNILMNCTLGHKALFIASCSIDNFADVAILGIIFSTFHFFFEACHHQDLHEQSFNMLKTHSFRVFHF